MWKPHLQGLFVGVFDLQCEEGGKMHDLEPLLSRRTGELL